MIQDPWQLHTWFSYEWIANPNPRARTLIIAGIRPKRFHQLYHVSFTTKKEMTLFKLKHSSRYIPITEYPAYLNREECFLLLTPNYLWKRIKLECQRVKYAEGPQ